MYSLPQRPLPSAWSLFLCALAAGLFLPEASLATSINVSSQSSALLSPGAEMIVDFGMWTYQANNPGYSPDPTSLRFDALGPQMAAPLSGIPGTSGQYYSRYPVTGYLESLDGSVVTPLIDANAQRLGLPDGSLLFVPGSFMSAGGVQQIAVLSASVTLSRILAESLFGDGASASWTAGAKIVLINNGPAVMFGLGNGYSMRSAFLEPELSGDGPATTSGVTLAVAMSVASAGETTVTESIQEPGTAGLLFWGLVFMVADKRRDTPIRMKSFSIHTTEDIRQAPS